MYADHITVSQKRIKAVCWVMHSLPHTNIWHSTTRLASVTCTACDAGLQQSQRNWGKMRHQWRWKQVKTKLIKSTDAVCVCLYVCVTPSPPSPPTYLRSPPAVCCYRVMRNVLCLWIDHILLLLLLVFFFCFGLAAHARWYRKPDAFSICMGNRLDKGSCYFCCCYLRNRAIGKQQR